MNRFIFACVCPISTHSFAAPYDANLDYQSKERVGQRAKYLVEACIQVEKDKIDEAKSRAALLKRWLSKKMKTNFAKTGATILWVGIA